MAIFRIKKTKGFSTMPNNLLQDKSISYKARGVLCYLLSKPDNWEVRPSDLTTEKDRKDAIRTALKELRDAGYILWEQQRDSEGRMAGYSYSVYDCKQSKYPFTENPFTENPTPTNNREEQKTEKKQKTEEKSAVIGKTALPADFVITDEMREWGEERYPDIDLDKATEQWQDWCLANDKRFKNWESAWRNGIHNAVKYKLAPAKEFIGGDIF